MGIQWENSGNRNTFLRNWELGSWDVGTTPGPICESSRHLVICTCANLVRAICTYCVRVHKINKFVFIFRFETCALHTSLHLIPIPGTQHTQGNCLLLAVLSALSAAPLLCCCSLVATHTTMKRVGSHHIIK